MPPGSELSVLCGCHRLQCGDPTPSVSNHRTPLRGNLLPASEWKKRMEDAAGVTTHVLDSHSH